MMRERQEWGRRQFLQGAGVAVGLPFLPSLFPGTASAEAAKPPTRMLFLSVPLGFVPAKTSKPFVSGDANWNGVAHDGWFPAEDGAEFKMPSVHAALEPYRQHLCFLKGLHHPRYRGDSHFADDVFLTGADTMSDPSRTLSNTISCDQRAAGSEGMGGRDVRYRSLVLGIQPLYGTHSGSLSWTGQGVPIPPLTSPLRVFDHLFGKDDLPAEARLLRLRQKKSVLDATLGQVRDLNGRLNPADRAKLDEVVSAVRDVEAIIQHEERWMTVPKPKVELTPPDDRIGVSSVRHARVMFDLIHAAFLTDSTRVITYEMPDTFSDVIPRAGKHGLNHAGDPETQKDAIRLDTEMSNQVASWVKRMCESKESDGQALLHHTIAAYGSGAWGPIHGLKNLPVLLIGQAGGKIKTGRTCSYPENTPLSNVWLTVLNACGVSAESFSDSTGTLDNLLA